MSPQNEIEISPEELKRLLAGPPQRRPVLLDVRNPDEHQKVRLPGSVLVPLAELEERLGEVPAAETEVVVYCHHGVRSRQGAKLLLEYGLKARSLAGGIDGYARLIDPSLPRY